MSVRAEARTALPRPDRTRYTRPSGGRDYEPALAGPTRTRRFHLPRANIGEQTMQQLQHDPPRDVSQEVERQPPHVVGRLNVRHAVSEKSTVVLIWNVVDKVLDQSRRDRLRQALRFQSGHRAI